MASRASQRNLLPSANIKEFQLVGRGCLCRIHTQTHIIYSRQQTTRPHLLHTNTREHYSLGQQVPMRVREERDEVREERDDV